MSGAAVSLILASAIVHVAWNLIGKRQSPSAGFFFIASAFGAMLLLPSLVVHGPHVGAIVNAVAPILVVTGLFQMLYYVMLAAAYRHGELSVAYPLARSLPPLLVLLASLAIGRGDRISAACIAGCLAVVTGGLSLARVHRSRTLREASTLFACLAAAGTAGYTLCDDHALSLLRRSSTLGVGNLTLVYGALEAIATSLWFVLYVLLVPGERRALTSTITSQWRTGLRVGIGVQAGYLLFLASLAFVDDVSYAAAFRQIGLPLGALAGIVLLGEQRGPRKLIAVGLCSVGAALVGLG